ncbi:hypothetical protein PT300_02710 [Enterobacteriaceae bacterium ESL0689]|nr:hypothetical protein [Enterobacteriaceae bacterium ESL0689]
MFGQKRQQHGESQHTDFPEHLVPLLSGHLISDQQYIIEGKPTK